MLGKTTMNNKTTKYTHIMRQFLLALLSLLAPACASAQIAKVYKNGVFVNAFSDSDTDKYQVVFGTHDYVEIGGLKWATMNIGATSIADSKETAFGDYYAWGEIDTYYSSISNDTLVCKYSDMTHIKGVKTGYTYENYYGKSSSEGSSEWSPKPYDSTTGTLLPEYDAARQEWGGEWRMPTADEFRNLVKACSDKFNYTSLSGETSITTGGIYWLAANTTVDKTAYNVEGVLFVDKEDTSKRLFFPAAGLVQNKQWIPGSDNTKTTIWTATIEKTNQQHGQCVSIYSSYTDILIGSNSRHMGLPVRPVCE